MVWMRRDLRVHNQLRGVVKTHNNPPVRLSFHPGITFADSIWRQPIPWDPALTRTNVTWLHLSNTELGMISLPCKSGLYSVTELPYSEDSANTGLYIGR